MTVANFQQLTAMANPNAGFGGFGGGGGRAAGLNGPNYQVPKLQQTPACASVPSIQAGLTLTNAIFQGEKLERAADLLRPGAAENQESRTPSS